MPNYQNGKIYKIINYENDDIYIGSTVETLSQRIAKHRANFKQYMDGKGHYITSFKILEKTSATIILLEKYPCNSKEELTAREAFYIKENYCVNKVIPLRTPKQYREDNKDILSEKAKQYREDNKDTILQRDKQYREDNKDILSEKAKDRYKNNEDYREYMKLNSKQTREAINSDPIKIEELKQYKAEWYLENKETISGKAKTYYEATKETAKARAKARYEANKDEINRKKREARLKLTNNDMI